MSTTDCPAQAQAKLEISSDRLTVTLKADSSSPQVVTPADLRIQLSEMGIQLTGPNLIEALAGPDGLIRSHDDMVLVQGTPPVPQQPAKLELLVKPPDPNATTSYYERTAYLTASPGQPIAKIIPAIPAIVGTDIFGQPIVAPKTPPVIFNMGNNVKLDDDQQTVRATELGRICQNSDTIWIETASDVPGDVDFSCENIKVAGDIHIRGAVLDLFKVNGSNIDVGGAVEGAEMTAAHDLHVAGGIVGKDKGHCIAGDDITCKFMTNAFLTAGRNISSHGEIAHSRLICGGRLTVERGPLTSGHVTANGGVACQSLGSQTGTPLIVEAGIDIAFISTATTALDEIKARKKTAQTQYTAGQWRQASETEKSIDDLRNTLREAQTTSQKASLLEILVHDVLHAGVEIRFPGIATTIECDWKGPLRLAPRQIEDKLEIELTDLTSKSTQILPSQPWHDPAADLLQKAMN